MITTALKTLARNSSPAGVRLMAVGGVNWLSASVFRSTRALAPLSVKIGVNSVCNARCKTCDVGTKTEQTPFYRNNIVPDATEMDLGLAKDVVDSLRRVRPKICIDSTEPLLYKDLGPFLRHVADRGMQSLVLTNGLGLADRAKELVDSGLGELVVSIDGPAPINDDVRGVPGLTEHAFAGLRAVERQKSKTGRNIPVLRVNTVISCHTQHHVADLLQEIADHNAGIASITLYHQNFVTHRMAEQHNAAFGRLLPVTMSNCEQSNPVDVDAAQLAAVVTKLHQKKWPFRVNWIPALTSEDDIRRYYQEHDRIVGSARCLAPWMIMRIKPNGDVGVIGRCFDVALGNCRDDDPLTLFNGAEMRRLRRVLMDNEMMPACKRCCGSL